MNRTIAKKTTRQHIVHKKHKDVPVHTFQASPCHQQISGNTIEKRSEIICLYNTCAKCKTMCDAVSR